MRTIESAHEAMESIEMPRYNPMPSGTSEEAHSTPRLPRLNGDSTGERIAKLSGQAVARAMETPVLRGLLPLAAGFSPNARGQARRPVLPSEEAILLYCVKGEGWCEIRGRRYRVAAEELL